MAENTKQCPHDCIQCSMAQQILCTAQMSHDNTLRLHKMEAAMERLGVAEPLKDMTTIDGGGENRSVENQQ